MRLGDDKLANDLDASTIVFEMLIEIDIVTDLYLKGLKEFKPTPAKASDAEGQVKNWSAPAAPKAPEAASDVASELSAYESAEAESSSSGSKSAAKESDGDWFELDTAPDHAHH